MDNFNSKFVSYKVTEPPTFIKTQIEKKLLSPETIQISQALNIPENFVIEAIELESPKVVEKKQEKKQEETKKTLKMQTTFDEAFNLAVKINPEVLKYKDFLFKTAKLESNFKNIQNTAGAPYYGYFLMGKDQIKATTGLTVDEFKNNPVQLILGAVNLYKSNLKILKSIGAYDLCKQKGYSDDAIMAGAWLGGPGGVKKYITQQGDPSDSHWYGNKAGTSVSKRMNNWNNV